MRRLVFGLFTIGLLCLLAHNAWQAHMLRGEVARLQKEVATLRHGGPVASDGADNLSLIAQARKHADRAKKYIADGDLGRAKVELEKSLRLIQRFSEESGESAKSTLENLRRMWRDAGATIERLRRAVAEESEKKSKGG